MQKQMREIAKFAAGLVVGDFLFAMWLYHTNLLPLSVMGIRVTTQTAKWGMVFDLVLVAFLFHYAWMTEKRARTSNERMFHNLAGTLFTLVALLHLSRLAWGWNFMVGSWSVPYWLNGFGLIITAFLAYASFHLGRRSR